MLQDEQEQCVSYLLYNKKEIGFCAASVERQGLACHNTADTNRQKRKSKLHFQYFSLTENG